MRRFLLPALAPLAFACGDDESSYDATELEAPAAPAAAAPASAPSPVALDALLGELPKECTRSEAGKRLLESSMIKDETGLKPLASAAVDAPAELAGVFGAPKVAEVLDDHTTIQIPVTGATLFGLPVASLNTYWGHENGIGGMTVEFAVPRQTLVDKVGAQIVDGEFDHPAVSDEASAEGHAVFVCDWSM